MLPDDLASIEEPEDQATEYLHYRQFFTIWETLAKLVDHQALEVSLTTREARSNWLKEYQVQNNVTVLLKDIDTFL
jgi:nuclear pore complex protein Nup107